MANTAIFAGIALIAIFVAPAISAEIVLFDILQNTIDALKIGR